MRIIMMVTLIWLIGAHIGYYFGEKNLINRAVSQQMTFCMDGITTQDDFYNDALSECKENVNAIKKALKEL